MPIRRHSSAPEVRPDQPEVPPTLVALRHPGAWPLAFGPYATGGVIHHVDPATAERLLARGFDPVIDPAPVTHSVPVSEV